MQSSSSDDDDDDDTEMAAATTTAADAAQKKRKADVDNAEPSSKKAKTDESASAESVSVFVGSLSWNVDEAWLRSEFESIGEIVSCRVVTERDSGRSKG